MAIRIVAMTCVIAIGSCSPYPGDNAVGGALAGGAMGCAIGAVMTAPLLGVGCVPGAIAGAATGGALGLAATPPQPIPYYYPELP